MSLLCWRGPPAQRRYPAELKAAAVDHARQAQAAGRSLASVAEDLGLSDQSLRAWVEAGTGEDSFKGEPEDS